MKSDRWEPAPKMSSSSNERLISEQVIPVAGSFNVEAMASGSPGFPMAFSWRGKEYRVIALLESWKNLRPCRSGSDEQYVNKHFFKIETASGEIMTLYRTRSGSKKDAWTLFTIKNKPQINQGEKPMRIAVLVSGGGTNLQALIDAQERTHYYEIALVIADREDAYALERTKTHRIPALLALPPKGLPRAEARLAVSNKVLALAKEYKVDALVLAGFLTIMAGDVIAEYSNRIINLHPALLPKFGGKGMWGHYVHEAVLASGDKESGCTVHLVDAGCDTGEILLQRKVPVLEGDTPDSLASRIYGEEHIAIVDGVCLLAQRLSN